MAKKKKSEDDELVQQRPGLIRRVYHGFVTVLALLAIVYVLLLFVTRTEGFRSILEGELEERLGVPVKIGQSDANLRFDLKFYNVTTKEEGSHNHPGLMAERVLVKWSWGDVLRTWTLLPSKIALENAELTLVKTASGGWEPLAFQPLSSWMGKWLELDLNQETNTSEAHAAGTVQEPLTSSITSWKNVQFSLRNAKITWWSDETSLALVDGIFLDVTPLKVPTRSLTHYALRVRQAESGHGARWQNLILEVLDTGNQQLVLVCDAQRNEKESPVQ